MGKCEEDIFTKEKEIAHLKFNVKEMKEMCDDNKKEIMVLKSSNMKMLNDVDSLKVRNEETTIKHCAEIIELQEKNRTLEKEIHGYNTKFASMFENLSNNTEEAFLFAIEALTLHTSENIGSNLIQPGKFTNAMQSLTSFSNVELQERKRTLEKEMHKNRNNFVSIYENLSTDAIAALKLKARNMKIIKTMQSLTNLLHVYKQQEAANKIVIKRHRGYIVDITVEHEVKFRRFSTVAAPSAIVPAGKKVFYEVTFKGGSGVSQIGWVTPDFNKILETYSNNGVGDCTHGYGFDGQRRSKWHGGSVQWGEQFEPHEDKVLGIALDMLNGKMLFGLDGDWNEPMGLAYEGINEDLRFFPACSANGMTLFINFGYSDFKYGPPDTSFEKLIDVIQR